MPLNALRRTTYIESKNAVREHRNSSTITKSLSRSSLSEVASISLDESSEKDRSESSKSKYRNVKSLFAKNTEKKVASTKNV